MACPTSSLRALEAFAARWLPHPYPWALRRSEGLLRACAAWSEAVRCAVGAVAARCACHDAAAAEDRMRRALSPCTGRDHRNAESGKNPFHHVHLLGLMFPGGSPVETDSVSLRFRFAIDSLSTRLGTVRGNGLIVPAHAYLGCRDQSPCVLRLNGTKSTIKTSLLRLS